MFLALSFLTLNAMALKKLRGTYTFKISFDSSFTIEFIANMNRYETREIKPSNTK